MYAACALSLYLNRSEWILLLLQIRISIHWQIVSNTFWHAFGAHYMQVNRNQNIEMASLQTTICDIVNAIDVMGGNVSSTRQWISRVLGLNEWNKWL